MGGGSDAGIRKMLLLFCRLGVFCVQVGARDKADAEVLMDV